MSGKRHIPVGEGISVLLASGSPRRRALLAELGWRFDTFSPDVDESALPGESPAALCERLARLKAESGGDSTKQVLVLAADTIVVVEGRVLGKPADRMEGIEMLRLLQGRSHEVLTGLALRWNGETVSAVERTTVCFRPLSEDQILAYAETGEGEDKAGSYAIQGKGALLVASIEGDYFNVVGFPLCRLGMMLESVGIGLESVWAGLRRKISMNGGAGA